jgi:hypothetical protein
MRSLISGCMMIVGCYNLESECHFGNSEDNPSRFLWILPFGGPLQFFVIGDSDYPNVTGKTRVMLRSTSPVCRICDLSGLSEVLKHPRIWYGISHMQAMFKQNENSNMRGRSVLVLVFDCRRTKSRSIHEMVKVVLLIRIQLKNAYQTCYSCHCVVMARRATSMIMMVPSLIIVKTLEWLMRTKTNINKDRFVNRVHLLSSESL